LRLSIDDVTGKASGNWNVERARIAAPSNAAGLREVQLGIFGAE
jgi:hypothetical protein